MRLYNVLSAWPASYYSSFHPSINDCHIVLSALLNIMPVNQKRRSLLDMEHLHIAVIIAVTFVILGVLHVDSLRSRGSRCKRQDVRIISNESFSCEQLELTLTKQNGGTPPRRIRLNDDDKMRLMRMRGFYFLSTVMASSEKEASHNADILQPTKMDGNANDRPLSKSEILARLRKDRDVRRASSRNAPPSAGVRDFPYVLPEDIGINRTIAQLTTDADFVTTIDYCVKRSTQLSEVDGAQYLRMCTACSTTTTTPPDIWPSTLVGAICSVDDNNCLYDGTDSYGRCILRVMPVKLLQRNDTECVLVLDKGQMVIAEDWQPITYSLGSGCECAVAEQSRFR